MLYGPDGAFAATEDPGPVAADATVNGVVPIDAATAPAPIALIAPLRAASTSGWFVCAMTGLPPWCARSDPGALPFGKLKRRLAPGMIVRHRRARSRVAAQCRVPGIVIYIGARS